MILLPDVSIIHETYRTTASLELLFLTVYIAYTCDLYIRVVILRHSNSPFTVIVVHRKLNVDWWNFNILDVHDMILKSGTAIRFQSTNSIVPRLSQKTSFQIGRHKTRV